MKEPKRVLLVEDNPDHAFLVQSSILASGAYKVDQVSTGKEALESIDRENYDIALLDYALPDINGLTLLSKILERSQNFPVVMMTGLGSEVVAVEAMKRGAYDYIVKSSEYCKVLPLVIEKALEKCELIKSNQVFTRGHAQHATPSFPSGIHDKYEFHGLYTHEVERAKRYNRRLSVIIIDIPNLSAVDDAFGYDMGNWVLTEVGSVLRRVLRASDIVAQYHDNGFAVVLLEAGPKQADILISRIEESVKQLNLEHRFPVEIYLSIGVSTSNGSYNNLLEKADKNRKERENSREQERRTS